MERAISGKNSFPRLRKDLKLIHFQKSCFELCDAVDKTTSNFLVDLIADFLFRILVVSASCLWFQSAAGSDSGDVRFGDTQR